ncbi:MAG TPA: hypothetical protein VNS58_28170 [Puia sp.]|nr:hypothetical protein [Puia sp.]
MINTTDLSECEVSLPGSWKRTDNGDIYSFTADHMEIRDDRLFKQLTIRHSSPLGEESLKYALTIKGDYCGVVVGEEEFIIKEITKKENGNASMEWEDEKGKPISFKRI